MRKVPLKAFITKVLDTTGLPGNGFLSLFFPTLKPCFIYPVVAKGLLCALGSYLKATASNISCHQANSGNNTLTKLKLEISFRGSVSRTLIPIQPPPS